MKIWRTIHVDCSEDTNSGIIYYTASHEHQLELQLLHFQPSPLQIWPGKAAKAIAPCINVGDLEELPDSGLA